MSELDDINGSIELRREKQESIKKDICNNIFMTFIHYDNSIKSFFNKIKIVVGNYKLKIDNHQVSLYVDKKRILKFDLWTQEYGGYSPSHIRQVIYFDNSALLEMQDFNDKFVEVVKALLLEIRDREEDEAIEMIALKSLT